MSTQSKQKRHWLNIAAILFVFVVFSNFKQIPEKNNTVSLHNDDSVPRLNVILILADDIGYEVPTYTGGQSYSTPNIDSLARNGMQFTQCHSAALCSPSRIMLMTGKYNFRNYFAWGKLAPDQKTIANVFKDAGYHTCVAGKWQFDGGDTSIHKFGFEKYIVFNPFTDSAADDALMDLRRYKNPLLYKDGAYIPDSQTLNKYSEDIFVRYISDFIDSNLHHPFFIYYPLSLCHKPFYPTPNDPEFAAFDPLTGKSNKKFFPSMVKYMDIKIGEVIAKVKSAGLEKNTLIIYFGDNGTPTEITSRWNNTSIVGGKAHTNLYGTHVPLFFYLPGTIKPGTINNDLVDFTDFLPTFADIVGLPMPQTYGPLDGTSCYNFLFNQKNAEREWSFCHYEPLTLDGTNLTVKRYVQTTGYKLYDSTGYFYNVQKDPLEKSPLADSTLTPYEMRLKIEFQQILARMHN